jgi:hypothetical protein
MRTMKAAVFKGPGQIVLDEKPMPTPGHLKPLVTHRFALSGIEQAYDLFGAQRDGVLKVAITP